MARTFTAGERTNIALGLADQDIYATLELKDPDGDWIDVTAFASTSWLMALTLEEHIDGNCQTLSGTLVRSLSTTNSLAPLMTASLRNRDNAAAYGPFLDVARQWRAKCAVVARGVAVVAGDWKEIGAGTYDLVEVDDPSPQIQLMGREWGASLLDVQITAPKVYSQESTDSMEVVIQALLDDTLSLAAVTLYTPTSPSFVVNRYEQQPMSLMQAINDLAALAGMVVRYRYDAADVSRLTLMAPDRTATAGDEVWTLDANEYWHIDKWSLDLSGIRDTIVVNYWDTATNAGASVSATNPTSIARYGGPFGISRTMTVDLSKDTKVVTAARAQTLADLILSDLDAPVMELQVETPGFWIAQLGDYGKFLANSIQFDTAQYAGVTSIRHVFGQGTMMTTLGLRGQPSGRYRSWFPQNPAGSFTDLCRIQNFRELSRSSTTITVQWVNEGNTEGVANEIWLYTVTRTQPTSLAYPDISLANEAGVTLTRLTNTTVGYTFDIPEQNTLLYGVLVPIGKRSVAGVPWRFTLQPTTATRLQQRARLQTSTAQSVVVRVEVANPIPGGDVSIAYEATSLTVTPASPQTVAAANVPTDLSNSGALTNYVDFTVTRPAPGANLRVIFTATSTDRIADVDAVDIPALDGIPQGTIAIPSGGTTVTPTAVLDGSAWVASYKWAESTSAFPTDATARAGTTANGRQVTIALLSALALADSVYFTALPYSVTAAGGVEGSSIRLKATRHDFTATKTVRFIANNLLDLPSSGTYAGVGRFYFDTNYAHPFELSLTAAAGVTILQLPDGVTITALDAELFTSNSPNIGSADTISISLKRISGTGGATTIGSATSTSHNGWETKTFTCSELTTGRQYQIYVSAYTNDGANPPRLSSYFVTYTMPNSAVAL
jgi:hypothetical protein